MAYKKLIKVTISLIWRYKLIADINCKLLNPYFKFVSRISSLLLRHRIAPSRSTIKSFKSYPSKSAKNLSASNLIRTLCPTFSSLAVRSVKEQQKSPMFLATRTCWGQRTAQGNERGERARYKHEHRLFSSLAT